MFIRFTHTERDVREAHAKELPCNNVVDAAKVLSKVEE